jgi:hypothetical protein
MKEIICPNCNKAFKIDEAGFADILKQVRDHEFEKELNARAEMLEKDKENAVKLAEANVENTLQKELAKKDIELSELKAEKDRELAELNAKKEAELAEMKSKISNAHNEVCGTGCLVKNLKTGKNMVKTDENGCDFIQ